MRVVRNIGYIRRRRTIARAMVGIGFLALVSAIGVTFFRTLILVAYACMILGFVLFYGGMQQLARWGRRPRNDEIIDAALTRLNDRYALIHYADFSGHRPDHLLIMPSGLLVLTSREIPGRVRVSGRRWSKGGAPLGRLFGISGPQLGNPTIENEEQVRTVEEFLQKEGLPGTVDGAIVFVHPKSEVELHDPTRTILHVTELLDYVRGAGEGVTLGSRERDLLIERLSRGDQLERSTGAPAAARKRARAA